MVPNKRESKLERQWEESGFVELNGGICRGPAALNILRSPLYPVESSGVLAALTLRLLWRVYRLIGASPAFACITLHCCLYFWAVASCERTAFSVFVSASLNSDNSISVSSSPMLTLTRPCSTPWPAAHSNSNGCPKIV
jgi:hypothetical protein